MGTEFKQTLLDDFVVVKVQDTTPSRIKLPDWQRVLRGEVIATGPGKMLYSGQRAPMSTSVGDLVSFAATAGMDTDYGVGVKVRLMHDEDVDAIFTDDYGDRL
jgi:chaperonin GroES